MGGGRETNDSIYMIQTDGFTRLLIQDDGNTITNFGIATLLLLYKNGIMILMKYLNLLMKNDRSSLCMFESSV